MGRFRYAGSVAIMGLALGLMSMQGAHAGVVITDNFSGSTPQANWPGDGIFNSVSPIGNTPNPASVDLVGPGFFQNLAPVGQNAVDLDGSTGTGNTPVAGDLQSAQSLALGNYSVQFQLAGNMRGAASETTNVCIGTVCQSITPANTQPYTAYNLTFTGVSGQVSFIDPGPSDQIGNLLANVVVSTAPGPNLGEGLLGFAVMSALLILTRHRGLLV